MQGSQECDSCMRYDNATGQETVVTTGNCQRFHQQNQAVSKFMECESTYQNAMKGFHQQMCDIDKRFQQCKKFPNADRIDCTKADPYSAMGPMPMPMPTVPGFSNFTFQSGFRVKRAASILAARVKRQFPPTGMPPPGGMPMPGMPSPMMMSMSCSNWHMNKCQQLQQKCDPCEGTMQREQEQLDQRNRPRMAQADQEYQSCQDMAVRIMAAALR